MSPGALPGQRGAGSPTVAGRRLPGAGGQVAPGHGVAAGAAEAAPGGWGTGAVETPGLEVLWAGRKVGFALRKPSVKQTKGRISFPVIRSFSGVGEWTGVERRAP